MTINKLGVRDHKITQKHLGLSVSTSTLRFAVRNIFNLNCQLMTIEAARSRKKQDVCLAAMLDPRTGDELDVDSIVKRCDELIEAHGDFLPIYR